MDIAVLAVSVRSRIVVAKVGDGEQGASGFRSHLRRGIVTYTSHSISASRTKRHHARGTGAPELSGLSEGQARYWRNLGPYPGRS